MKNEILLQVEEFVYTLLSEKSSSHQVYHDIYHTGEVVKSAEEIGGKAGLSDSDLEIVLIAAWFHDTGYVESGIDHETRSAEFAGNFLKEHNYDEDKIIKVIACIMATKVPQNPKSLMQQVLCDADLHHLGKKKFFEKNELFRTEEEIARNKIYPDFEWIKNSISFLNEHQYFTDYAREKFDEGKQKNLLKLQKQLRKKSGDFKSFEIKKEKNKIEKEKLENKKLSENKPVRGIETMFRNIMRTHVSFSSMADSKANIMISVNTLLLGAIATILARKLDTNPQLIIPTLSLSLVSLTTLIFAILVTRPQVNSGIFTKEDIEKKQANLLFFGNFYKMKLEDFTWGMQEMMNDEKYMYVSMIKDFYYLGQVLGRKFKYLRICYTIFMYGFIISLILFIIFIAASTEPTQLDDII